MEVKNLKLNEQKLRDLHLRKLALGELQGPPTGYASQDKPWLKYFSEEMIMEDIPEMTCYEYLYQNNQKYLDQVTIEYFSNKITYRELFKKIDETAMAYQKIGVKKGDIVTICSITTPEIIYSFYGLNKIGAIVNFIDVRYTEQAIKKQLEEVDAKYLLALDICYPKVKSLLNNLDKTIFFSATNSASKPIKIVNNLMTKVKGSQIKIETSDQVMNWNEFIAQGKNEVLNPISYEKDDPAVIIHTGGTTGEPKGAVLSNYNFLAAIVQVKNSNANISRGDSFLNIMPPFIAYGTVLGINAPLTLGWTSKIIPKFDADKFADLLIKHKPNAVMGVPAYWENVMKSEKMNNHDLSYIKVILLGGDSIKAEFEKRLEKFLIEKESTAGVGKGYSMTEASACATFSSKKSNKLDSVGVPLTKTTLAAFTPDTTEELPIGEIGEICFKTPTMMLGYYNNPEKTKEVIWEHEDGEWIHSADLGYIDKDGLVFIKDRIKRMIPRSGFKVFPSEIESLFMSYPGVENCAVVGIPDPVDVNAPKAHIVLKKEFLGYEEIVKDDLIRLFHSSELPPYFEPVDFKFRDSLPLTNIGKVDFVALQNEEKELTGKKLEKRM